MAPQSQASLSRQLQREVRSLSRALDPHLAAVHLCDGVYDDQVQAAAGVASGVAGALEAAEDAGQMVGRDA